MNIDGKHYRTIWPGEDGRSVEVIDQTQLPHVFATMRLTTVAQAASAISTMVVRRPPDRRHGSLWHGARGPG